MADTGNTASITFGTSGFTASFIELVGAEETRAKLEDSHLGTTDRKEYVPDDLVDSGEMSGRFYWDGATSEGPPITGAPETITRTFPLAPGQSTAATEAGTGFVTRSKTPDMRNGELMVGEFTICWDGKTGPTYTPGS